jgi:hypothetical protein
MKVEEKCKFQLLGGPLNGQLMTIDCFWSSGTLRPLESTHAVNYAKPIDFGEIIKQGVNEKISYERHMYTFREIRGERDVIHFLLIHDSWTTNDLLFYLSRGNLKTKSAD